MQLDNIGSGLITASLYHPDCRLLALACHHAAAACRGSEVPAGSIYALPQSDGTLSMLYEALAGAFEAAGLAAYEQGELSHKDVVRCTLASFLAGELED